MCACVCIYVYVCGESAKSKLKLQWLATEAIIFPVLGISDADDDVGEDLEYFIEASG